MVRKGDLKMGIGVLIIGHSGSGKSTSLRNCAPDRFGVVNVEHKPLPFRTELKTYNTSNYFDIFPALKQAKTPSIVIDDAGYLLTNEFMSRGDEKGYQKFTDMATRFWTLVHLIRELPDDRIVYLTMHIEKDADGLEKPKTIGRLLDEKVCIEGMFTIVLKSVAYDGKYVFKTRTTGNDVVKTPIGMFESDEIENDLKLVDDTIREYYGLTIKED